MKTIQFKCLHTDTLAGCTRTADLGTLTIQWLLTDQIVLDATNGKGSISFGSCRLKAAAEILFGLNSKASTLMGNTVLNLSHSAQSTQNRTADVLSRVEKLQFLSSVFT